jgi:hypothetical protein
MNYLGHIDGGAGWLLVAVAVITGVATALLRRSRRYSRPDEDTYLGLMGYPARRMRDGMRQCYLCDGFIYDPLEHYHAVHSEA